MHSIHLARIKSVNKENVYEKENCRSFPAIVLREMSKNIFGCFTLFPDAVHPQVYAAEDDRSERELSPSMSFEKFENMNFEELVPLRKANMKVKILVR